MLGLGLRLRLALALGDIVCVSVSVRVMSRARIRIYCHFHAEVGRLRDLLVVCLMTMRKRENSRHLRLAMRLSIAPSSTIRHVFSIYGQVPKMFLTFLS